MTNTVLLLVDKYIVSKDFIARIAGIIANIALKWYIRHRDVFKN